MTDAIDQITARRFNVLIVDDSESDRILTARLVSKSPCLKVVATVSTGELGKEYLLGKYGDRQKFPLPDLLLVDMIWAEWIKRGPFSSLRVVTCFIASYEALFPIMTWLKKLGSRF